MAEQIEIRSGDTYRVNLSGALEIVIGETLSHGYFEVRYKSSGSVANWHRSLIEKYCTLVSRAPAAEKGPEQPEKIEAGQRWKHPTHHWSMVIAEFESPFHAYACDDTGQRGWVYESDLREQCTFLGYAKPEGECGCTNVPSTVTVTFGPPTTTPDDLTLPTQPTERRAIDGLGVKLPDEPLDFRKGLVDVVRVNEIEGVARQLRGAME